ncbi:histidinol dehydrogenase [Leyella lascolaii]|uniref:histidinol dehydrogenase n=1 Tax=Leyella lascolaii TaxID=1776379 RepID=UPI00083ABA1A|nr:histidinol dehydrogenase [Leyella lascolaii]
MRIVRYPEREVWKKILERPHTDISALNGVVDDILEDVRNNGDEAVRRCELRFDGVSLQSLAVTEDEIENAVRSVDAELKEAIELAHSNIGKFHMAQRTTEHKVETVPGVSCWQKSVAIQKVGLYVPGGTAPLFSTVLMLATPARIAGCDDIVLCTPPDKNGNVNPAILVAAKTAGVDKIYKIGGVQAIGAMAYGTETVPKVYKIFGPGNRYVMAAKQRVSLDGVAIDMPAGPSEVCVIADETSNVEFVAADLLSQAEHGTDSQVLLISTSESVAVRVSEEIDRQLAVLPRRDIAARSLENSLCIIAHDGSEAMEISNAYAPEHLVIATEDYDALAGMVVNAGSVFLGKYACESAGDYASGTNHTLPTHGYATAYNGVNLDSYIRKITFQHITPEGVMSIGRAVEVMAENEQLEAHKNAMTVRLRNIGRK